MSFDLSLARGLDYYTGLIYEAVVEGSAPPSQLAPAAAAPAPALASSSPSAPAPPAKKSKKQKAAAAADAEPEVDESTIGVGSIAAGGRYDELVGMFASAASAEGSTSKNVAKSSIPCVGVSVGVERVFSILLAREKEKAAAKEGGGGGKGGAGRKNATEVYVMSVGEGLLLERMQIAKELWAAGIKVRFSLCFAVFLRYVILAARRTTHLLTI